MTFVLVVAATCAFTGGYASVKHWQQRRRRADDEPKAKARYRR